ncbi:host attachment protein [Novosphingobium humi]|uniref:host attachment protein n=1 Tax=Novosphingobium humi TaxID=2282397 RepID=UPI0025B1AC41|nr:host attachment protein [Novosphingobium humi]WJS99839.1 host attachment protein [Novosphingobium humi]
MLLPHGTVIAVIDAHNFRLLRNIGDEANPELAEALAPRLDTHNHSGASHHGSTVTMAHDAHAAAAVEWLAQEVQGHRIAHLVVIAAPRSLGELRKAYTKGIEQALLGELAKDLGEARGPEILAQLRGR